MVPNLSLQLISVPPSDKHTKDWVFCSKLGESGRHVCVLCELSYLILPVSRLGVVTVVV